MPGLDMSPFIRRRLPQARSDLQRRWLLATNRDCTLQIDPSVRFGAGLRAHLQRGARLTIEHDVSFRDNCVIEVGMGAELVIGAYCTFGYHVIIQCTKRIDIGRQCMFANATNLVDSQHRFDAPDDRLRALELSPLTIGERVWAASKVTIAADVGEHSVLAANAAVVSPVPPHSLVGGVPGRVIREIR
jgi:acetyltransferase-like isoleucine patch superfamily enzyme